MWLVSINDFLNHKKHLTYCLQVFVSSRSLSDSHFWPFVSKKKWQPTKEHLKYFLSKQKDLYKDLRNFDERISFHQIFTSTSTVPLLWVQGPCFGFSEVSKPFMRDLTALSILPPSAKRKQSRIQHNYIRFA